MARGGEKAGTTLCDYVSLISGRAPF